MKIKKTCSVIAVIASLSAASAFADKGQTSQDVKGGLTFLSAAVAGGIAGGPIGFVLGGLGGAYWAEQGQAKFEQEQLLETSKARLEASTMSLNSLEKTLEKQDIEIAQLEKMISEKMQFQMYFKTGQASLTSTDETQIQALADFLAENSYMHVAIDGHADPRGDSSYNIELSTDRAQTVANILKEAGISDYRMDVTGHGANFSSSSLSSLEDYAEQRRVNIQVFPSKESGRLAGVK